MTILEKIKALLAKAASTTNMAEAAAFAEKAHELMEKYQIDIDAIRASDDPVGRDQAYTTKAKQKTWQMSLTMATARYYGCRSVYTTCSIMGSNVEIFGRESARITAMEMMPYFVQTVNRMAREMAERTRWDSYKCAKQIGLELAHRLFSLAPEMENTNEHVSGKNALVRIDEINALVEQIYPKLKTARKSSFRTSEMAAQYAGSVNLANQMGSRSALKIGAR
jgi:hypothetical protein